ncbi:MAG: MGMT family protein [Candidatus Thermoplasmatota archaeon]|nr:MGMT family protein [Candidatus Thermoplasmatota archaeon]
MIVRKADVKTDKDIVEYLKDWPEFERKVYVAAFKIPRGKVSTYQRVAKMAGNPRACRATANALHKNPLYPIVPCHRVVRADGSFGGDEKRAAGRRKHVREEGVPIKNGKVDMSDDIVFG